MKKYRIVYWCHLWLTECFVIAHNEEEAKLVFERVKGLKKDNIKSVEAAEV